MTAETQDNDPVVHPITTLAGWLKQRFRHMAEDHEWQALDQVDRTRIAHDLGMSSSELDVLMADGGGSAELDVLLGRLGLRQAAAVYGALHDMQRVCGLCQMREDCRDWLAVPAEARDEGAQPYFCPNHDELKLLQELQTGSSGRR